MLATTTTIDWSQLVIALMAIIGSVFGAWQHLSHKQTLTQAKVDSVAADVKAVAGAVNTVVQPAATVLPQPPPVPPGG